jgi:hypothetical protein
MMKHKIEFELRSYHFSQDKCLSPESLRAIKMAIPEVVEADLENQPAIRELKRTMAPRDELDRLENEWRQAQWRQAQRRR